MAVEQEKLQEHLPEKPKKTYGLKDLVRGRTPREGAPEDTVFAWPHLLIMEIILILGTTLVLFFISWGVDAPLRELGNPLVEEDPAKAPWYFLNLQELLLHMNPALAGVIVPTIALGILAAVPYLDRSQEDEGIWFSSSKGKAIAAFSFIYTTVIIVGLVLLDHFWNIKEQIGKGVGDTTWEVASWWQIPVVDLIAGWIIPVLIMVFFIMVLVAWVKIAFKANLREMTIALFTGFFASWIVLIAISLFFRGLSMVLTPIWDLPPGALSF